MAKALADYKVDLPEGVSGDWGVLKFEALPSPLMEMRLEREGREYVPGSYTRLYYKRELNVIMSDTPDEVRDHLEAIHRATGRVLINGLGLGMVLKATLDKPEVTSVDVVELEEDVLNLVAHHYTDPRITYHQASAYDIEWPVGTRWDVVWHDIWAKLSGNHKEMTALKRKYADRCDWQGCWGEYHVSRYS